MIGDDLRQVNANELFMARFRNTRLTQTRSSVAEEDCRGRASNPDQICISRLVDPFPNFKTYRFNKLATCKTRVSGLQFRSRALLTILNHLRGVHTPITMTTGCLYIRLSETF